MWRSTVLARLLAVLPLVLTLAACEGSGVSGRAEVFQKVEQADLNSVFLYRDNEFVGSAALFSVQVDGETVGTLGLNETVELKLAPGKRQVSVLTTGVLSATIKPARITFDQRGQGPRFVLVGVKQQALASKITLLETTRDGFLVRIR